MEYIVMGISSAVIIAALMYFGNIYKKPKFRSFSENIPRKIISVCPLCQMSLHTGENLYSKVYRPMTVPDQRCTVSGCPYCYPKCAPNLKRICPVCHKAVPSNGYLIARLFNKPDGKKHVHVLGCTECFKNAKKNT
ncbi:hypothetical protein [Treponema parvum]|uniref:hypothetical protein n=1 Tax=Treponema parvum TaxID=138851 RepID=UPI001AEBF2FB|nr:hypothetical protein [Treponema parvum]QTQ17101.1 hypothetical protein HXT04_10595 [Treponema parvum]